MNKSCNYSYAIKILSMLYSIKMSLWVIEESLYFVNHYELWSLFPRFFTCLGKLAFSIKSADVSFINSSDL